MNRTPSFAFSLKTMLRLIVDLHEHGEVSENRAKEVTKCRIHSSIVQRYYGFLIGGKLATRSNKTLRKTENLDSLYTALIDKNHAEITKHLSQVESFRKFLKILSEKGSLQQHQTDLAYSYSCYITYRNLAEFCCAGVRMGPNILFNTPCKPQGNEFADMALSAYEETRRGESWAQTGLWLEELAQEHGTHPVHVREELQKAFREKRLHRFFEGSTPDTRFENKKMNVLEVEHGKPKVCVVHLYHGDFLFPGRASVGVKIVDARPEPVSHQPSSALQAPQ